MKKASYILMALALVLGLSQCKKNKEDSKTPTAVGDPYTISVTLGYTNDKAGVVPNDASDIAPVNYEVGDKLLVAYCGKWVGEIECKSVTPPSSPSTSPGTYNDAHATFEGDIYVNAIDGISPLYFYFFNGYTPEEGTFTPGSTDASTLTIDISDQTGSKLPVISYAASEDPFTGDGTYSIWNGFNGDGRHWLLNQCALVKFTCENIYDMSANDNDNNSNAIYKTTKDITIYGMDNKVSIDLASTTMTDPHFSWTQVNSGAIKLHTLPADAAGDGSVRYAIIHQGNYTSVTAGDLDVPFDPSVDFYGFYGTYKIAHDVKKNDYFDGGKIDLVWHSGAFTVASGQQVVFSRGNLQYKHYGSATADGGIWRFAKHQYDWVGGMVGSDAWHYNNVRQGNVVLQDGVSGDTGFSTNEQIGEASYVGWIDLYGYGTGDDPTKHSVLNSQYNDWHEWGAHSIVNSGKPGNTAWWQTLTHHEWKYLLSERDGYSSKRGTATVNGVKGLVLLPDNSTATIVSYSNHASWENNTYTTEQWKAAEAAGAVFLPCAGYRNGTDFDGGTNQDQDHGVYHSSSMSTGSAAWGIRFKTTDNYAYLEDDYPMAPDNGHAVRLVHRVSSSKSLLNFPKKP